MDTRKELMLATLAGGATWQEAADRVGVSERTLYRWCAADPDLAARAAEARDMADDQVEAVTFKKCLDPDPANNTLRMFWLKCRRPEVYRDKIQAHITSEQKPAKIRITEVIVHRPADLRGRPDADPPLAGLEKGEIPPPWPARRET